MASGFGMSRTATSGFGSVSNSSASMLRPSSALLNKSIRDADATEQSATNPTIMTEGAEDRCLDEKDDDDRR